MNNCTKSLINRIPARYFFKMGCPFHSMEWKSYRTNYYYCKNDCDLALMGEVDNKYIYHLTSKFHEFEIGLFYHPQDFCEIRINKLRDFQFKEILDYFDPNEIVDPFEYIKGILIFV